LRRRERETHGRETHGRETHERHPRQVVGLVPSAEKTQVGSVVLGT
jgi:hypothetical protein